METLLNTVASTIMELPPEDLLDKDILIATSIVKAIDSFSKVNRIILASRLKPLTEAKQEAVGVEISKALFYGAALVYLLELPQDGFEEESVKAFGEEYEDIYQQDAILCSITAITNLAELATLIYADPLSIDEDEVEDGPVVAEGVDPESPTAEEDTAIAGVFAACWLLTERLKLSFENLQFNAGLLDKI